MTSMIRLLLSVTHFCARRRTFARPSKPIASHSGCALRARAASALTSSADIAGTVVITSPVAGFSTGMPAAPFVDTAAGLDSTVAMASPSVVTQPKPTPCWPASQEAAGGYETASELVEDAGALGAVLGRRDHAVVAQLVELAQALRDSLGRRRPATARGRGRRRGWLRGGRVPRRRGRAAERGRDGARGGRRGGAGGHRVERDRRARMVVGVVEDRAAVAPPRYV